jgi:diguanylate cyclase (GGDEF)-like protein
MECFMVEGRREPQRRSLRSGKIIFNNWYSVIDCIVRTGSDGNICLQVDRTGGVPSTFELAIEGEDESRRCKTVWLSESRIGIEYLDPHTARPAERAGAADRTGAPLTETTQPQQAPAAGTILRGDLLTIRAALDQVPVGIVLLDADTRAQFINRAFRRMWRLPDAKADSKPPFVALMYHGRDTRAYAIASGDLDAYVADRVAHIKAGDPKPFDLRLANGEVIRLQCTVLPSGGRMLCYTDVTDIVTHADELQMLRGALDEMQPGIILLDECLNAQFINRAARKLRRVDDEQGGRKLSYAELVNTSRESEAYGLAPDELNTFVESRIAVVRAGDPTPIDIPHSDGGIIRSQCAVLPNGGRMVTYTDVSDLVLRAKQFEQLAALDAVTGIWNRRQFDLLAEAEWVRFQRYHRPLSILVMDIDRFRQVNDQLGHEAGDRALKQIASVCTGAKRGPDIVGRLGGDEFAVLLPETGLRQAEAFAQRLRGLMAEAPAPADSAGVVSVPMTVSMGIAQATVSMSGTGALMRLADKALYEAKAAGRNCVRCAEEPNVHEWRAAAE